MNIFSRAKKIASEVYTPMFAPTRARRIYEEYDQKLGFGSYHDYCKQCFSRKIAYRQTALNTDGYQFVQLMDQQSASEMLGKLTAQKAESLMKKGTRDFVGYSLNKKEQEKTLELLFTPGIDENLLNYFGSEYLVHWMVLSRTASMEKQKSVSFKWHCDRGPTKHLKLMLYLNSSEEHGGNTEFLDLSSTSQIAEKGYIFGRTRNRTDELSELSRLFNTHLHAEKRAIPAGHGIVFQPANVLHRGVGPTAGSRYVLTLCLLPSPVPWREAYNRGVMADLSQESKWPAHADDLLHALETTSNDVHSN